MTVVVHMSADQFGQMMVQATRYALGRRTTAPLDTKRALVCAWEHMPPRWREIAERDVREEVERAERLGETVGDRCDHETWSEWLAWVDEMHGVLARLASPSKEPSDA